MKKNLGKVLFVLAMGSSLMLTPQAMAKKKLNWWVPSDATWKQMESKFEKENPGVDVVIVNGEIDKFYTMITAGMMPDIWGPWATPGIHADVNRNWAVDLTPYIKRDSKAMNMDDFFPGVLRQFKISGKQYSLPIFSYADYYFYNTQLYAQAGLTPPPANSGDKNWNWDRMLLNAQKSSLKDANGKLKQSGIEFSRETKDFPNWFHMWNAEPYSEETLKSSVPQSVHYSSPEMVNCLTRMWELMYRYNVTNPAGADFTQGKSAASLEHGWRVQDWMKAKKLKWAMAPLPWAVTDSGTLWPDGWRMSRVCKDKELAWKFIKFLASPENMRIQVSDPKSAHPGTPVVRKSVFKETLGRDIGKATGMDPDDVFKIHEAADEAGVVKYQETVCLHVDLDKFIKPEFDKLWANKVGPKEAAVNIQKAADKALPVLFTRWLRNVKFTGADKVKK